MNRRSRTDSTGASARVKASRLPSALRGLDPRLSAPVFRPISERLSSSNPRDSAGEIPLDWFTKGVRKSAARHDVNDPLRGRWGDSPPARVGSFTSWRAEQNPRHSLWRAAKNAASWLALRRQRKHLLWLSARCGAIRLRRRATEGCRRREMDEDNRRGCSVVHLLSTVRRLRRAR